MFSKSCKYGIKATIYIAHQSLQNKRVKLQDIVEEIATPVAFTAKILQELSKNKIIISHTGPHGGFEIRQENMKALLLRDIVFAIDGDGIYKGCGLGFSACSSAHPCPIHYKFGVVREGIKRMLESTTIYELAVGIKDERTYLKL